MITQMLLLDFKVVEIPAVMHARTSGEKACILVSSQSGI